MLPACKHPQQRRLLYFKPTGMPHAAFSWRYAVLAPPGWRAAHGAARAAALTRDGCAALLTALLESGDYALGTTKVFMPVTLCDRGCNPM